MQTVAQASHRAHGAPIEEFLKVLRDTGNVTAACMVSGYNRRSMYRLKERDAEFRELFDEAVEIAVDKLEHVARKRAVTGVKKPLAYKGEIFAYVHEPSDRLMELLLKAHRPDKFNPVQKLEHSGGVSVSVVQFGEQGATQPVTINQEPSAMIEGGTSSDDPTPKLAAALNDEGCQVASFSDLEPE